MIDNSIIKHRPVALAVGAAIGPEITAGHYPTPRKMSAEQQAEMDEALAQIAANEPHRANQAGPSASGTTDAQMRAMEALEKALSSGRTGGPARDVDMSAPRSRIVRPDRGGFQR
ncbi:hypothetical protein [Thiocapsa sp. UBA6158]|jgi:hypothetical protein|uniref:hypothetical protein n=1 Tax=Thiocapsa sp. UBA6158 TaxID=1947692 RepID=UPI0025F0BAA2|nr:hypothetical protein [Thiocapsa sp. UBA6158]